jgi:hypothetical protein
MFSMRTFDIEEKIAVAIESEYLEHINEPHLICQLFRFLDSPLVICYDREFGAIRWGHDEHRAQTLGEDGRWYTESGEPIIDDWGIEDVIDYVKLSDKENKETIIEHIIFNLDALSVSGPKVIMPKF